MIKKELERRNITANEFAKMINVTPGNLSKFFNKKSELSFITFLNMIHALFPEKEMKLMEKYVLSCSKPKNVRLSMEYVSRHYLSELLEKIVEKSFKVNNSLTEEFAELYKFLNEMSDKDFPKSFMSKFLSMQPKERTSKLLLNLIFSYYLLKRSDYRTLFELLDEIQTGIEDMKDGFLKDSFKTRVFEIYSDAYLALFEIEKTRKYAQKILEYPYAGGKVLGRAYHNLGFSYLFESKEKTTCYLEKSVQIFNEYGYKKEAQWVLGNRLMLVKNYYSMVDETYFEENKDDKPIEYAHFLVKSRKYEEALRVLESVPDNPLKDYIKGLCFSDKKGIVLLYRSMLSFERIGNKFSSHMVGEELRRRGYHT
ncbi:AimR family lysis-lysogeny pheromone receptor [Priestia filamentosa]|uniref:AimR family lysis-lysogeny pheromone receptor n=1 Tax=Priestia filamentosa TaxID=1402861 RepID=UPI00397988FF